MSPTRSRSGSTLAYHRKPGHINGRRTFALVNTIGAEGHAPAGIAAATDLSGSVIREVDTKPPWVIASELSRRAEMIRDDRDSQFKQAKTMVQNLPPMILRGRRSPLPRQQRRTAWSAGTSATSIP